VELDSRGFLVKDDKPAIEQRAARPTVTHSGQDLKGMRTAVAVVNEEAASVAAANSSWSSPITRGMPRRRSRSQTLWTIGRE
jgi:hypothetical protein